MSAASRLKFFYAFVFAFYAVHLAYWPLWLKLGGLSDTTIGQLLAFGFLAKVAVNPAFRSLASRAADTRRALGCTLVLAGGVFALFGLAETTALLIVVQMAFFVFWVPVLPTTEYLAMSQARAEGFDYGRVRLWGSVAFLVASVLVGRWLERRGIAAAYGIQLAFLALIAVVAWGMPAGAGAGTLVRGFSLARLLSVPGLTWVLLAAGLVQGSHAMFYGFSSIYWKSIGLGETVIGLLWAEGIVVEIAIFLASARIAARMSPAAMLAVGGTVACVRWLLMPLAPGAETLAVLQLLHGASFALTHLGAVGFVGARVPQAESANAMALYSMTAMGVFMGVAVLASGWLYTMFGGRAFWCMALFALAGAGLAIRLCRGHTPSQTDPRDVP